jgi:sugar phosphate isomerase/epimerase
MKNSIPFVLRSLLYHRHTLSIRTREETFLEIMEYIELASRIKCPFVRILAAEKAAQAGEVDDEMIISSLRLLAPAAEKAGVTLVVETNGVYSDTKRLGRVIDEVGSDSVKALWTPPPIPSLWARPRRDSAELAPHQIFYSARIR